jgi:RND family efflux transporter MFP subunit
MNSMKPNRKTIALGAALAASLLGAAALVSSADDNKPGATSKPALTVTLANPVREEWPGVFSASGNIVAWQEAIIGAEVNGLRIADVLVNVGDRVKKGQALARFAPETVEADNAQAAANVAEAEAALAEAEANAERAKTLENSGALSAQQIQQFSTAAKTAAARLVAARAAQKASAVRLANTEVRAPDSGTISARQATVGQVVMAGQDLFRMVRKNRLEWRGEVTASELNKIAVGQRVTVFTPANQALPGTVRVIAPTIDPTTRNVQVMVDLDNTSGVAKAGMFARGEFALPGTNALTVPRESIVLRDGHAYVFVLGAGNRVAQKKVKTGRLNGSKHEIIDGLAPDANVVAKGAGFLNDGDLVAVAGTNSAPVGAPNANK